MQATATRTKLSPTPALIAPEPASPVTVLVDTLAAQLACAQENATLLYMKLEPVRCPVPQPDAGSNRPLADSPLEGRLADLIDAASFLNASLSNLRAELRI